MNHKSQLSIVNSQLFVAQALLAALLFGLNAPFSKMLLGSIPPMYMAAFLYLGAAVGMAILWVLFGTGKKRYTEAGITRNDTPWVVAMILLDIAAPFLLMSGLRLTTAASASLLMNFEMVATSFLALLLFKESMGARMWLAIGIITIASMVLSVDFRSLSGLSISSGSLLILGACLCWGLENNCTGRLSAKDPSLIVIIKGFGSGLGALALALATEKLGNGSAMQIAGALALGFVAYGLSIFFYVKAQRGLGAARTSMYYATAPFLGVMLSFLLLGESIGLQFGIAAVLMVSGAILAVLEKHAHSHSHLSVTHEHRHCHDDGHHGHSHDSCGDPHAEHNHEHKHEPVDHSHEHRPDMHHRHAHHH